MKFIECQYKEHILDYHAKNEVKKWVKKFTNEKHKELQKEANDKFKKSKAKSKKRKIIPQLPEPRIKVIEGCRLQIYSDYAEEELIDELATFMEGLQLLTDITVYEEDAEAVMKADDGIDLSAPITETLSNANFKCTLSAQFEENRTVKVPTTFCNLIQKIKHKDKVLEFDVAVNEDFLKIMEHLLLNIPLEDEEKQSIHKGHVNMVVRMTVAIGVIESDYQLKFSHYYIPEFNKNTEEFLFIRYVFSMINYRTIKQDTGTK